MMGSWLQVANWLARDILLRRKALITLVEEFAKIDNYSYSRIG